MTTIHSSAPGKAVLLGEYAVLDGAPALVMAVERRARVRVETGAGTHGRVEVPQLGLAPVEFRVDDSGLIAWDGPDAARPSFQRARLLLDWLAARHPGCPAIAGGVRIRIDTGELYQAGQGEATKLGLGSSAAMTVALAAALEALAAPASSDAIASRLEQALLAPYRAGQAGRGSGIDLAASLHGGVSRYQLTPNGARTEPVTLPDALHLAFVWTGQAASTPDFLDRYARWTRSAPDAAGRWRRALTDCCRAALETLDHDDADGLMTCINNYRQLMGRIGSLSGAPVVSESLDQIARTAAAHGLACKPCGAGGGDLAMLAGTDEEALDKACLSLAARGWPRLGLTTARRGLRLDSSPA